MRTLPLFCLLVVLAVAGVAATSCADQALPGTDLGRFSVVGTASANTCGSGIGAPNPWDFAVELSQDDSTLYWSWLNDTPAVSGTLDSSSSTTITAAQSENVDGTDAGAGPCTMERDDSLTVTLGKGAEPSTFTGTLTYTFEATSGSNCSDQLTSGGGEYAALPCTVSFALAATKQ